MSKDSRRYTKYSLERVGDSVRISASPGLDRLYRDIFYDCQSRLVEQASLKTRVQIVVFGCFWIEAVANSLLQLVLDESLSTSEIRESVWESVKYQNIHQKLEIIATDAGGRHETRWEVFAGRLKYAFDLRNRLVHFKDEYHSLREGDPESIQDLLIEVAGPSANPIPEELSFLSVESVNKAARAIRVAGIWLEHVRTLYLKYEPDHR